MKQAEIGGVSPFFIVSDVPSTFSFYRDRLGFEITFQVPGDDVFFGIVRRGGAMIMFKSVEVDPLPNYKRDPAAAGTLTCTFRIPTHWQPSLRRATSSFPNR